MISARTVRDHVKAIYDKAGVGSRGELLAELFSNHVFGRLHSTIAHLDDGVVAQGSGSMRSADHN